MKDNLIDEDKAKQEEAAQENLQQKIDRLGIIISIFYRINSSSMYTQCLDLTAH